MIKKVIGILVLAVVLLFVAIQLVPFGRQHANPPVVQEPAWDSPQTRELARRACFDCHSNETIWPWYSNIAPVSWLVRRDVDEGRQHLNFSEWGQSRQELGNHEHGSEEIAESLQRGQMPPFYFLITHPEARLSAQEKRALIQGLIATTGAGGGEGEEGEGGGG
jgi:hypothetical protein